MAPTVDLTILEALSLDPKSTLIASHGSSGFASTFKITSKESDGKEKLFFVKQGKGADSEIMFAGEHMSLNAIHNAVPTLCPKSHAYGKLSNGKGFFLATDFLDISSRSAVKGSGESLAQKLARLHNITVPTPEGHERPVFGFPVPTCCGDTVQDNKFKTGWAEFYADNRLRGVLSAAEKRNGRDAELADLVEKTVSVIVPRLLEDGHLQKPGGGNIDPAVVHGDLWSGNHSRGTIDGGGVEEVVFDPSSTWAHAEFEFGIMRMFGGFGRGFEEEYHRIKPKDEPVEEWEDRVELYELYHHLNHYSIFGAGYRSGAVRIMRDLYKKYGDGFKST